MALYWRSEQVNCLHLFWFMDSFLHSILNFYWLTLCNNEKNILFYPGFKRIQIQNMCTCIDRAFSLQCNYKVEIISLRKKNVSIHIIINFNAAIDRKTVESRIFFIAFYTIKLKRIHSVLDLFLQSWNILWFFIDCLSIKGGYILHDFSSNWNSRN